MGALRAAALSKTGLWLPVIGCMVGIFIFSAMPDPPTPVDVPDVSLHGLGYFGLTLLLIRALAAGTWRGVTWATLACAWAVAVVYGATDEYHQSFVPGRTPDVNDLFADAIGSVAAVILVKACDIIRRL